jgi:hypothetical protein
MSEQKIEQFWRDATAEDVARVMKGEKVEARFRDYDDADWAEFDLLGGFATSVTHPVSWIDFCGVRWFQCQVYAPKQWWLEKPDPGEGYRLLEKFPQENLQCNDEYWSRRENKWLPSPVAATGSHIQLNESWYRRRIDPNVPEIPDSCERKKLEAGKEYLLPSGLVLIVHNESIEVKHD